MDFPIVKKGYAPAQVNEYIQKQQEKSNETIAAQHARIEELLQTLEEERKELNELRAKKEQINAAILGAVKLSDRIKKLSKMQYANEMAQLKAYHEKWTAHYEKLFKAYPLSKRLSELGAFNRRMDAILSGGREGEEEAAPAPAAPPKDKKVQIGYIRVDANSEAEEVDYDDILPDADPDSPVLTGDFDPIERIKRYFEAEREREKEEAATAPKEYTDRSESGFSLEEALNPTEDLIDILKDLGF